MATRVISKDSDARDQNRGSSRTGATDPWWENRSGEARYHAVLRTGRANLRQELVLRPPMGWTSFVTVLPPGLGNRQSGRKGAGEM